MNFLSRKFLNSGRAKDILRDRPSADDPAQVSGHMESFVRELYTQPEVKVVGAARGPAGHLITRLFIEAFKAK